MSWLRGGIWNPPRPKACFLRIVVLGREPRVITRVERVRGFAEYVGKNRYRVFHHVGDAAHFTYHPALLRNGNGLSLEHVVGLILAGEPLSATHRHIRARREPGHECEPTGTYQNTDLGERFLDGASQFQIGTILMVDAMLGVYENRLVAVLHPRASHRACKVT